MSAEKIKKTWASPEAALLKMTLEEKISQLWMGHGWHAVAKPEGRVVLTDWFFDLKKLGFPGALCSMMRSDAWTKKGLGNGLGRRDAAEAVNLIQRYATEETRTGIPLLLAEEGAHGLMAIGGTTFPVGLGMAASWNKDLLHRIGCAVSSELAAVGAQISFGPVLDLSRDPRWGRCEENFGEDVCVSAQLGAAMVRGIQESGKVICTLKHFAGYGVPESGHNAFSSHIGSRELHNVHLPPFEAAIRAGAGSVMSSYNDIDGIPASADGRLFNGILRQSWGFRGIVISDSSAVPDLKDAHRVAAGYEEASAMALKAGVDMDLCPDHRQGYRYALKGALDKGLVVIDDIDRSVLRVLDLKFRLGLFENPYVRTGPVEIFSQPRGHRELAREAAQNAVVLLKNENGALPLSPAVKRIALIGPNADDIYNMLGDYTSPQPEGKAVTLRAAMSAEPGIELMHAKGCSIKDPGRHGFEEALECARSADVVVAVTGGSSKREYGSEFQDAGQAVVTEATRLQDMECGETVDRATLDLMGVQNELISRLKETGKPLITILIHGRAMAVQHAAELSDALLTCFYPGEQGGSALCDVLFGRIDPSGRLPVTFPRSAGQLPAVYTRGRKAVSDYADQSAAPLFPFGFGLSYTQFAYEKIELDRTQISTTGLESGESVNVTVTVRNPGEREGVETVQLYLHDEVCSVVRPVRELKAFGKIRLPPGATGSVTLPLNLRDLACWNQQWLLEPGRFQVIAASDSSQVGVSAEFEVVIG
jgi:beta-glucosidase